MEVDSTTVAVFMSVAALYAARKGSGLNPNPLNEARKASMLVMADPPHPEHDERKTWIGGDFDPTAFSIEETNRRLTPEVC